MARKRQLTVTREESTEDKLTRQKIREALEENSKIQLTPPKHLNRYAKAEYRRIRPLLEELPIANLDKTMVDTYCHLYGISRVLQKNIDEEGSIIEVRYLNGDVKEMKPNPSIGELLRVTKEIRYICAELGMTISSRMRLLEPTINDDDPFKKMLEGD